MNYFKINSPLLKQLTSRAFLSYLWGKHQIMMLTIVKRPMKSASILMINPQSDWNE